MIKLFKAIMRKILQVGLTEMNGIRINCLYDPYTDINHRLFIGIFSNMIFLNVIECFCLFNSPGS